MPIMLMGSTLSTELSTVITAPSGAARSMLARLKMLAWSMPPLMATQFITSGPL